MYTWYYCIACCGVYSVCSNQPSQIILLFVDLIILDFCLFVLLACSFKLEMQIKFLTYFTYPVLLQPECLPLFRVAELPECCIGREMANVYVGRQRLETCYFWLNEKDLFHCRCALTEKV